MVSFFFKRLNEASIFIETSVNLPLITSKEKPSNGLAFLRKSHGGCNSPLDCCQEPPFESILAPSALRCSVLWGSVSFFWFCRSWWAKMDSNHRPHDYQSCALASWAIGPFWWRLAGSNRWPPACKAGALPAELNPQIFPIFLQGTSIVNCQFSLCPLNWITLST